MTANQYAVMADAAITVYMKRSRSIPYMVAYCEICQSKCLLSNKRDSCRWKCHSCGTVWRNVTLSESVAAETEQDVDVLGED